MHALTYSRGDLPTAWQRRDWIDNYPSRETALAIVEALRRGEAGTSGELERLTGVPNVLTVADRCYLVYGYEELEPATLARGMTEVFMRPRVPQGGLAGGSDGLSRPTTPAAPSARPECPVTMTYGFTRRA